MRGLLLAVAGVAALAVASPAQADICYSHSLPVEPHEVCVPKGGR